MKNNILIIGDSSSLPREKVEFNKTFYLKIKQMSACNNIEITSVTNNTSRNIYYNLEFFMLYGYKPDIVILNYGIVDVYPRPYPNKIYRLLACTGLLQYVDKFLKKTNLYYKLGDLFNFKEVSIEKFEQYSKGIIEKLLDRGVKKIIIIGIIKPYKVLLKSHRVDTEIKKYNAIFENFAKNNEMIEYIDIYNDSEEDYTIWDGYHYSEKASQYLADKIKKVIEND
jgi:lysophospholipase L1-like esterase